MYAALIVFSAIGFIAVVSLVANLLMLFFEEPQEKRDLKNAGTIEIGKTASITTPIKSKNE